MHNNIFKSCLGGILCLSMMATVSAEGHASYCHQNANYFADFYEGLHKMNRHGLENFPSNSPDLQAYFVQVQKNGEKLEANVIKGINNDVTLNAKARSDLIEWTHAMADKLRSLSASDALNHSKKDKDTVFNELLRFCP